MKIPTSPALAWLGLLSLTSSQAALVWDGSSDGVTAFAEANWTQHAGGDPGANTINPSVVIANNATLTGGEIVVSAGTGSPSNIGSPSQFLVGTNNVTVSGGKILGGGSTTAAEANPTLGSQGSDLTVSGGGQIQTNGITGFNTILVDGGIIDLRSISGIIFTSASGSNPHMSITNGATVDSQYINGTGTSSLLSLTLNSASTLILNGSGTPLNTLSLNFLDTDSRLRLTNEVFNNGSGSGFEPEHITKVKFNGASLVFGADPFSIEDGDNAIATSINSGLGVQIQPLVSLASPSHVVLPGSTVTLNWNAPFFESYSIDGGIGTVTGSTVDGIGSTTVQVNSTTTFTLTVTKNGGATVETSSFTVVTSPDSDSDGLLDYVETNTGIYNGPTDTGTNPAVADTDSDGLLDGVESHTGIWQSPSATGTNPLIADTDGDGLLDGQENPDTAYVAGVNAGSNPHKVDTDHDGFNDAEEFTGGADPTNSTSFPALRATYAYDVSDRLASNAAFSTDNWTGSDLANWIAGTAFSDRYGRNDNDGDDRITRTNDAGFSYVIPADVTRVVYDVDFRINGAICETSLTQAGANTLGFGYDAPNSKFFLIDGATKINQTGTTPPPADSRKTIRLILNLVSHTADLIMDPAGAAILIMNDTPVSVTAGQLNTADGISMRTSSKFTGVYRYNLAVFTPLGETSAYDDWAGGFGLDPDAGGAPGEDADKDGNSNQIEFATNGNPNSGTSSGKVVGRVQDVGGSDVLTLTIPVRGSGTPFSGTNEQISDPVDGVIYRIQGSSDLSDWGTAVVSEVVPALGTGLPPLDAGWEYRSFRISGNVTSAAKRFIRAVVESAP